MSITSIEHKHDGAVDDEGRLSLLDALHYLGGEIANQHGGTFTAAFSTRGRQAIFAELVRARGGFTGGPFDIPRPPRPFWIVCSFLDDGNHLGRS